MVLRLDDSYRALHCLRLRNLQRTDVPINRIGDPRVLDIRSLALHAIMFTMAPHPKDARVQAWFEAVGIGRQLQQRLEPATGRLVEARALSAMTSSQTRRGSYRLRFSKGRALKACLFESEYRCQRVRMLLAEVEPGLFPRVVLAHGPWLVAEWTDGREIPSVKPRRHSLTATGRLQGKLHRSRPPESSLVDDGGPHGLEQLGAELQELEDSGGLARSARSSLLRLAERSRPESWLIGIVHGDLCGENLIMTASGQPVAIDFETLDVDALDFDLARTWYRWPLSRRQRETYLKGYREYRSVEEVGEHFLFWAIRATVQSALFRVRNRTPEQEAPLAVLKRIVREAEDPATLFIEGAGIRPRTDR